MALLWVHHGPMAATKKTKPKRRKAVLKEESIHIRLTMEQKDALTEAATKAGLGLSTWLLTLGLRNAEGGRGEVAPHAPGPRGGLAGTAAWCPGPPACPRSRSLPISRSSA